MAIAAIGNNPLTLVGENPIYNFGMFAITMLAMNSIESIPKADAAGWGTALESGVSFCGTVGMNGLRCAWGSCGTVIKEVSGAIYATGKRMDAKDVANIANALSVCILPILHRPLVGKKYSLAAFVGDSVAILTRIALI